MKLGDYKIIFVVVGLIGVLLIASPAIAGAIRLPDGEHFSELYLLGPTQMAEHYPSTFEVGQNYSIHVNVGNHLGSSASYVLYVKFGNTTDQLPSNTLGVPSPLAPLYEYRFSIPDGMTWQSRFDFSVANASIQGNNSQINTLKINGATYNADKSALWDSNSTAFRYRLFFELWLYNDQTESVEFNNRYVSLQLNLAV